MHGDLRRGRRAAPDHRLRVRARGGGPPRGAGHRRARRRASSTSARRPGAAAPRTPRRWCRTCSTTYQERDSRKNVLEAYHDAIEYKEECLHAVLARAPVARASGCWPRTSSGRICQKILQASRASCDEVPEELEALERALADTYFCNFSMFQSLPDSGRSISSSRSCPSTGSTRSPRAARCSPTSPATPTARSTTSSTGATSSTCSSCTRSTSDDYYLGIFLVGAYQEILGDLHNLFGDTNTVHVSLAAERRLPHRPRRRRRHGDRGAQLRQLLQGRPGGARAPLRRGGAAQGR